MTSIDQAEMLLRDFGNAAHALTLYPGEHPRARAALHRIEQSLLASMGSRLEVSIVFLDGRIIAEGMVVPGGVAAARGLARSMQSRGKDRMTIRRGATVGEIEEFLRAIVSTETPERWSGTDHIRLESLRGGLLVADYGFYGAADGDGDAGFLQAEAGALSAVWDGVSENGKLKLDLLEDIVSVLSRTVSENMGAMIPLAPLKSHDQYTFTHIINVGMLGMGLAEVIGLPPRTVKDIGVAALLHDVGKSCVPEEILNKPDRLTDEEFTAIKKHPVEGARLLLRTPGGPELAVAVAYEHHVRYDGGGYPSLPPGWRLSLASAITQIADFYDALRTHRPYRRGMLRERIESIMREESGHHFEPELLRAFFQAVVPREGVEGLVESASPR